MKVKSITNYIFKVEFLFLIGLLMLNIIIIYTSLSKKDHTDNNSNLISQNSKDILNSTYINK